MEMVNGYVFLDLTKSNVYSKALKVLGTDKPVVIKDGSGSPYFVDSLTLDGTNVVITKGGKTITIANDNTITNVGDIQPKTLHLYKLNFSLEISSTEGNFMMLFYSNKDNLTKENITFNEINKYEFTPLYDINNNFVGYYFENFYLDGDTLECNVYDGEHGEQSADSGTTIISDLTKLF